MSTSYKEFTGHIIDVSNFWWKAVQGYAHGFYCTVFMRHPHVFFITFYIICYHILNLFNVKRIVDIKINILSIIKTCNVAMNVNSNINNRPY